MTDKIKVGIIGGGFSGTMTAVQLIEKASAQTEIILVVGKENFNRGTAYQPYSKEHLLNVTAGKMSAYSKRPDHFLDWLMNLPEFQSADRTTIKTSFLPRHLYGDYVESIWKTALAKANDKGIDVTVIKKTATELSNTENGISILLDDGQRIDLDKCVIATGNQDPRNPAIPNSGFYVSKRYFQNPWKEGAVKSLSNDLPVLIIGNGLTMADTVLALLENGFKEKIYSLSPNGFNIFPHIAYKPSSDMPPIDIPLGASLHDVVTIVNKRLKAAKKQGGSVDEVIDSLRPLTQRLWRSFSEKDKSLFMSRIRHLWGVARHRIPLQTYDKIHSLQSDKKLFIRSGKILDMTEEKDRVLVSYFDKKDKAVKQLTVARIINCTGPETDLSKLGDSFLKTCLASGMLSQDLLKLGITADPETFQVIDSKGLTNENLYTLGSNLKGLFWESTAVNELRLQAEVLAEKISKG